MITDQLFDRQLNYLSKASPTLVHNYISTYGKDALLLKQDRAETQKYTQAYGVDVVGYGLSSRNYERIPIKVVIDVTDWGHIVTNAVDTDVRILMEFVEDQIKPGDLIQFMNRGIEVNYRVQDNVEIFNRIYIRFSARLVINKDMR